MSTSGPVPSRKASSSAFRPSITSRSAFKLGIVGRVVESREVAGRAAVKQEDVGFESCGLALWNNAVNEKITLLWKGYSTGRAQSRKVRQVSKNYKFETNEKQNSKHEFRNLKQKGKTQNTKCKRFKNAGEVLIGGFWILRIEILELFRISIFPNILLKNRTLA